MHAREKERSVQGIAGRINDTIGGEASQGERIRLVGQSHLGEMVYNRAPIESTKEESYAGITRGDHHPA